MDEAQVPNLDPKEAKDLLQVPGAIKARYWRTCREKDVHKDYVQASCAKDSIVSQCGQFLGLHP